MIYKELESLGFFDWLDQKHDLKDTEILCLKKLIEIIKK